MSTWERTRRDAETSFGVALRRRSAQPPHLVQVVRVRRPAVEAREVLANQLCELRVPRVAGKEGDGAVRDELVDGEAARVGGIKEESGREGQGDRHSGHPGSHCSLSRSRCVRCGGSGLGLEMR